MYAVEASSMHTCASALVKHNQLEDRMTVISGKVEEISLPSFERTEEEEGKKEGEEEEGKVDVLISEPIGFLLVHERMLESYIDARDRFLRSDGLGKMFPSRGTILFSPMSDEQLYQEHLSRAAFWFQRDFHGVDVSPLYATAVQEFLSQATVGYFSPSILLSSTPCEYEVDFRTVQKEELVEFTIPFSFTIEKTAIMHGLGCWFDVHFDGSAKHIVISTAPDREGTHWYQCRLFFSEPVAVNKQQTLTGTMAFKANNKFSYDITLEAEVEGTSIRARNDIKLQDQYYHYLGY